jgi:uncharacterized membrane protein YhaH (DUF805 family)
MKISIKKWFAKWNDFNSDANRKEFWIGFMFSNVLYFIVFLYLLAGFMPSIAEKITTKNAFLLYFAITAVFGIYFLALLVSATIRRLNHAGLSKWWAVLIATLIGSMVLVERVWTGFFYVAIASFIGLTIIWLWPGKK